MSGYTACKVDGVEGEFEMQITLYYGVPLQLWRKEEEPLEGARYRQATVRRIQEAGKQRYCVIVEDAATGKMEESKARWHKFEGAMYEAAMRLREVDQSRIAQGPRAEIGRWMKAHAKLAE